MRIAVGCPIRDRAWIFDRWVEHVRAAYDVAGLQPYWVFNIGIGAEGDDNTFEIVTNLYKTDPGMWCETHEPAIPPQTLCRRWNMERFGQMSDYRNNLLSLVRAAQPDYFFSVDSDILLDPTALLTLLETIERPHMIQGTPTHFDAVGGKTYLSVDSRHMTTYALLSNGQGLRRQDSEGVFQVDAIMAMKLMSPAAYAVPYKADQFGEDIGWSKNCTEGGLKLGWDGRVASKHVMDPAHLDKIDPRLGW